MAISRNFPYQTVYAPSRRLCVPNGTPTAPRTVANAIFAMEILQHSRAARVEWLGRRCAEAHTMVRYTHRNPRQQILGWSVREPSIGIQSQFSLAGGRFPCTCAIHPSENRYNHSVRFNHTLRQRVSRLVRDTLAFSKKLANHLGAIKYFVCRYNLTRAAALPVSHYLEITTDIPVDNASRCDYSAWRAYFLWLKLIVPDAYSSDRRGNCQGSR